MTWLEFLLYDTRSTPICSPTGAFRAVMEIDVDLYAPGLPGTSLKFVPVFLQILINSKWRPKWGVLTVFEGFSPPIGSNIHLREFCCIPCWSVRKYLQNEVSTKPVGWNWFFHNLISNTKNVFGPKMRFVVKAVADWKITLFYLFQSQEFTGVIRFHVRRIFLAKKIKMAAKRVYLTIFEGFSPPKESGAHLRAFCCIPC